MARNNKFKPSRLATGFWYILTFASTSLFAALLLGVVLRDNPANWMYISLVVDGIWIAWLIYSRHFTTTESIAWGNRK